MRANKVELLAPAGSMDAFIGAIHAGADAVYLGGKQFGARAYAANFSDEDLLFCIKYAHLHGRRVYLTINTLTRNSELCTLYDYLLPLYENGLDGVIIQDMGVYHYVSRHFPDMERHISTQMTVTGREDAMFMKKIGANRIVPARELSLQEIRSIKEYTGLEMECFIHGAMCYCYSGQCLFSSILGERSGNRGRCAQPCRLPYQVSLDGNPQKEQYPLSLKDMCTIEYIPRLIEAGIDSFKIEGRMKSAEYAAGVTAIYRKYIDSYYQNHHKQNYKYQVSEKDIKKLTSLYLRSERQDGYYFKHNGKEMITLENPSYAASDENLVASLREKYILPRPTFDVEMSAYFYIGSPAVLTLTHGDNSVTIEGPIVTAAEKQPITAKDAEIRLCKLGNTHFKASTCDVFVEEGAYYPVKELNELRRNAVTALEKQITEDYGLIYARKHTVQKEPLVSVQEDKSDHSKQIPSKNLAASQTISCSSIEQLKAITKLIDAGALTCFNRLILEADLLFKHREHLEQLIHAADLSNRFDIYISLPYIIRDRDTIYMQSIITQLDTSPYIKGVCIRSISGLEQLKKTGYKRAYLTDAGFYLWNSESIAFWKDQITEGTLPYELNGAQQKELLAEGLPFSKIIYGRIPMMITANCVAKTTKECRKPKHREQDIAFLKDRYHKTFPVQLCCEHCYNIIYNSLPLSLHQDLHKWYGKVDLRIHLTTESFEETLSVLECYEEALSGAAMQKEWKHLNLTFPAEYTTGHEKRGAI